MFNQRPSRHKMRLTILAFAQSGLLLITGCSKNETTPNLGSSNSASPQTTPPAQNSSDKGALASDQPAAPQGADQFSIDQAKLQIAIDKNYARQYAVIAKKTLTGKPLEEIADKYRELNSVYNGWLTVVVLAVESNDKKFDKGGANKQKAKEAAQKNEAFVNLVRTKTSVKAEEKIAFGILVGALIDAGVKIWKAHKEIQAEERERVARYIEKALKWEDWEQIPSSEATTASPSPSPTASTKRSPSQSPTASPKVSPSPSRIGSPKSSPSPSPN